MEPKRRTKAEWKATLDPMCFHVTREAGTERAFTGKYWDTKEAGCYKCACCGQVLFESKAKYDSGSGWPSYSTPAPQAHVEERSDATLAMARTEVRCGDCDAHLGHLFPDGPAPTGLRYCINSAALAFDETT